MKDTAFISNGQNLNQCHIIQSKFVFHFLKINLNKVQIKVMWEQIILNKLRINGISTIR